MISEKAIEKAIEGGWTCKGMLNSEGMGTPIWSMYDVGIEISKVMIGFGGDPQRVTYRVLWQEIALDAFFWRALGQMMIWYKRDKAWAAYDSFSCEGEEWLFYAMKYQHTVLTGGDLAYFWKSAL